MVEAGCVLANVQQYVQQRGFYFPIRLASEGSCQIGGNIACNAGGGLMCCVMGQCAIRC